AETEDRHGAEAFAAVTVFSPASGGVATIGRNIWRSLRPRQIDDFNRDRMRLLLAEDRHEEKPGPEPRACSPDHPYPRAGLAPRHPHGRDWSPARSGFQAGNAVGFPSWEYSGNA